MTSHSVVGRRSTSTLPDVGVSKRLTNRSVVVLPQPDSPSRTSVSPAATVNCKSSMIGGPPSTAKLTSRNSTSGVSEVAVKVSRVYQKQWSGDKVSHSAITHEPNRSNPCPRDSRLARQSDG